MRVCALSLRDFRSYAEVDVELKPGISILVGPNGQGKTNLVEAIEYVATQTSHRVATDAPLVRSGAQRAVVRTVIARADREAVIELEINPGGANRARLNRGSFVRPRDVLSILRTVVFSPGDIDLVRGDPGGRRRFLDTLLVARRPRYSSVRAEYDRVIRQRSSLLKTMGRASSSGSSSAASTLDVWDAHAADAGAELLAGRLSLVSELRPHLVSFYRELSSGTPKPEEGNATALVYSSSAPVGLDDSKPDRAELRQVLVSEMSKRRTEEMERGVSLVGPHRDDLVVSLGSMPARGYASHGESWSLALALRLAAFQLLRSDGDDPVLVLDDVFAELDDVRRQRLATVIAPAEQVLVTAAVPTDVPSTLRGVRFDVRGGEVQHA